MRGRLRILFYLESVVALASVALLIGTLVWRNWIEIGFGLDPDQNSGLAELAVVAVCIAIAIVCTLSARWEWRRARAVLRLQAGTGGARRA